VHFLAIISATFIIGSASYATESLLECEGQLRTVSLTKDKITIDSLLMDDPIEQPIQGIIEDEKGILYFSNNYGVRYYKSSEEYYIALVVLAEDNNISSYSEKEKLRCK